MRLTRIENSRFYRNTARGELRFNNGDISTKEIIDKLPHKKSFLYRVLRDPSLDAEQNKGGFAVFLKKLINEGIVNTGDLPKVEPSNLPEFIEKHLSIYGRNLKYDKEADTFEELLKKQYNGKNVNREFRFLKDYIAELISHKKDRLEKSISRNRIPFKIEANKVIPSSAKMKWLFSFPKPDGIDGERLAQAYKKCEYSKLHDRIKDEICKFYDGNNKRRDSVVLSRKIYNLVLEHNKEIYQNYSCHKDKNVEYDMDNCTDECKEVSFLLIEIRNHFRKYFPYKKNSKQYNQRIDNMSRKSAKFLSSEKFVFQQVKKKIINQLVAGLIQYGKIHHYFIADLSDEPNNEEQSYIEITSDDLSNIQVEEAFKKQIFLSLAWAITRLNYFYNYRSNNPDLLDGSEKNAGGDITCDDEYINSFVKKLDDENEQVELLSKLKESFPIANNEDDKDKDKDKEKDKEKMILLLEAILLSVSGLRHNIFHYRKKSLLKIISEVSLKGQKPDKKDKESAKEREERIKNDENRIKYVEDLLEQDINVNLQERFKEKIRSSGVASYYCFDTLKEVFSANNGRFKLYSPQYPMMPSFKKVFTKGCNIYKSNRGKYKCLKWYVTKDGIEDNERWIAYKNLLQLFYTHSFLSAVSEEEKLITDFINKTISWSCKASMHNKGGNKDKYRYRQINEYIVNTPLSDYLRNLQREQSIKENENHNVIEKKNYYREFVQDLVMLAFADYMDNHLQNIFSDLNPEKENHVMTNPEEIINNLFTQDEHTSKPILEITTSLSEDKKHINIYNKIYPFLRVLDQRELNNLLHQFVRYRTAMEDIHEDDTLKELKKIEELIALMQYTIPPITNKESKITEVNNCFLKFFEGESVDKFDNMYRQEDGKSKVVHRNMALIERSGALSLYSHIYANRPRPLYKVEVKDFERYRKLIDGGANVSSIADKQKRLAELHNELVTNRNANPSKESIEQYKALLKSRQEYNDLHHKLTFHSLYRIHQIHVDILARFAAFAQDWERDMFFLLTALRGRKIISDKVNVNKIFEEGSVVGKLKSKIKGHKKLLFGLCWCNEIDNSNEKDSSKEKKFLKRFDVRNSVAHLNHMTQDPKYGPQPSIIKLITRLRNLLAYDMKRQNAVTTAVQDILEKHQIKVTFLRPENMPNGKQGKNELDFELASIKSCEIRHLKNLGKKVGRDDIIEPAHNQWMLNLVEELLKYEETPSANDKRT